MSATAPTVFVIDDDKAIRSAVKNLLESVGLRAEVFSTPREFLKTEPRDKLGCLVLDVRLPGASGEVRPVPDSRRGKSCPARTLPWTGKRSVSRNQRGASPPAYAGPCPPTGSPPHHYIFTVSAVSKQITLAPGATADELGAAIKGNVLAQGKLTGTYQRSTGAQ